MPRPFVVPVRFSAGPQVAQATTGSVNVECAFVRCVVSPRPGSRVSLRLYLRDQLPVELVAVVRERAASESGPGFWADFLPDRAAQSCIARALAAQRSREVGESRDRRALPRHGASLTVRFGTVGEFVREYTTNISAGGMFIRTEAPPELHEVIRVSLDLPGAEQPVEAQAEVVHRVTVAEAALRDAAPGVGVQFVSGDDQFRERIDRYLTRVLPEKSIVESRK